MNFDELTRDDLLNVRIKCDDDLLYFTRFWFKVLKGSKFIVAPHHIRICKSIKRIEDYELELLNINIPPRFSKTELAAVNFIARGIGMNPSANFLYITASDELRAQTSVSIRDIVSHPYFKIMYGVELKKDQNGKNLWRTNKGGGLKTATIFGQVTGFGAGQMIDHNNELDDYIRTFEGCIVLDDVNKIDDSGQENVNNAKVSRIIFNTILSRKNSKDTPIINIQQRAGLSDATEGFKKHYGVDNLKAEFLVMPVVSEDGVPLWEWKHNLDDIEFLRTSDATKNVFETQYMQVPVNEKAILLPYSVLKFAPIPNKDVIANIAIADPADGGGDKLSVIFLRLVYTDNKLRAYMTDVVHSNKGIESNAPRVMDRIRKWKTERIFIEKNGVGVALVYQLNNLNDTDCRLQPYNEKMNKDAKINAFYEFVQSHFIINEAWETMEDFPAYMSDLTSYERDGDNKHKKDAIDVACAGAKAIKTNYSSMLFG